MIFNPSAKALAYQDLHFIVATAPTPAKPRNLLQVFDEVANEIQMLFSTEMVQEVRSYCVSEETV